MSMPGSDRIRFNWPSWPCFVWNNYADTVTLDDEQPKVGGKLQAATWECGDPACVRQDTLAL